MDRRDFVKLASGLLVPATMTASLPAAAARSSVISKLPAASQKRMAWTVDDGRDEKSVQAYLNFSWDHFLKMSFFITSNYPGWRRNQEQISYLLKKGILQLGNHTRTHKDLTKLSAREVKNELMSCHNFIEDTFGVDARPYYRPPYGAFNDAVIHAAADIGYTKTMLWSGSVVDTAAHPNSARILRHAGKAMKDRRIVLSHANHMATPAAFPDMLKLIRDRGLLLVKLNEVV